MKNAIQHLLQQRALLQKEYAYEKATFQRETEVMGIGRKIKRGQCWFPVSFGRAYYNSLNQFVIEVLHSAGEEDVTHNFEYGRPVFFFISYAQGTINYFIFIRQHGGQSAWWHNAGRPVEGVQFCGRPALF